MKREVVKIALTVVLAEIAMTGLILFTKYWSDPAFIDQPTSNYLSGTLSRQIIKVEPARHWPISPGNTLLVLKNNSASLPESKIQQLEVQNKLEMEKFLGDHGNTTPKFILTDSTITVRRFGFEGDIGPWDPVIFYYQIYPNGLLTIMTPQLPPNKYPNTDMNNQNLFLQVSRKIQAHIINEIRLGGFSPNGLIWFEQSLFYEMYLDALLQPKQNNNIHRRFRKRRRRNEWITNMKMSQD